MIEVRLPFDIGTEVMVNTCCLPEMVDFGSLPRWYPAVVTGYDIRKGRRPMVRVKVTGVWPYTENGETKSVNGHKYVSITDNANCIRLKKE